jgi:hypothetical protein
MSRRNLRARQKYFRVFGCLKSEIRNPKSETNSKSKTQRFETSTAQEFWQERSRICSLTTTRCDRLHLHASSSFSSSSSGSTITPLRHHSIFD